MPQSAVLTGVDVAKAQLFVYNDKNWDKLRQIVTQNFAYNELPTGRKTQGIDQALEVFRAWAAASSDSKATINNEFVSGNTVVLELTWNGTHTGPLNLPNGGQIPASGKRFSVPACQVVEVSNDKVNSIRHYFDMASLLSQIGAFPR